MLHPARLQLEVLTVNRQGSAAVGLENGFQCETKSRGHNDDDDDFDAPRRLGDEMFGRGDGRFVCFLE